MFVQGFFDEATFTITYLVADEDSGETVIIDPVTEYDAGRAKLASTPIDLVLDVDARLVCINHVRLVDDPRFELRELRNGDAHRVGGDAEDHLRGVHDAREATLIVAPLVKVRLLLRDRNPIHVKPWIVFKVLTGTSIFHVLVPALLQRRLGLPLLKTLLVVLKVVKFFYKELQAMKASTSTITMVFLESLMDQPHKYDCS